jgi:hypothetical protein
MSKPISICITTAATKLMHVRMETNGDLTQQFASDAKLRELLLFLEWRCRQPRGLTGLVEEILQWAGDRILPAELRSLRVDRNGRLSLDDCFLVWTMLPRWARVRINEKPDVARMLVEFGAEDLHAAAESGISSADLDGFRDWLTRDRCISAIRAAFSDRLSKIIVDVFAQSERPLASSLNWSPEWEPASRPQGWKVAPGLPKLLIEFMEDHAERVLSSVAETRVTRMVYEALDYCWQSKSLVPVTGTERFGKTESVRAYCNAHPGRARLVHLSSGNSMRSFLLSIAEALGLEFDCTAPSGRMEDSIRFCLVNSGLMLIFDEFQYVLPANISRLTPPARLNFIRREIVDRGLPCVIVATPQAQEKAIQNYVDKTKYAMGQWIGRVDMAFVLPEEYRFEDMVKVARVKFPAYPEKGVRLMAAKAMQSEQFLRILDTIANWSRFLANRAGRTDPSIADIERACADSTTGITAPADERTEQIGPTPARTAKHTILVSLPTDRGDREPAAANRVSQQIEQQV